MKLLNLLFLPILITNNDVAAETKEIYQLVFERASDGVSWGRHKVDIPVPMGGNDGWFCSVKHKGDDPACNVPSESHQYCRDRRASAYYKEQVAKGKFDEKKDSLLCWMGGFWKPWGKKCCNSENLCNNNC